MEASMYLLRKRAVLEPAMRLPTMLARPMRASDQLATDGGRPQRFTLARQVRDEEGDVKSAGEESGVQE
jgi:hypothetical protein